MTPVEQAIEQSSRAKFAKAITDKLAELGLSQGEFTEKVYGANNQNGRSRMRKILSGTVYAAPKTLKRWATVLGMTISELQSLYDRPVKAESRALVPVKPGAKPSSLKPEPAPAHVLNLTISLDGRRATLRLNLTDVPVEAALSIMNTVNAAGVLK